MGSKRSSRWSGLVMTGFFVIFVLALVASIVWPLVFDFR